MTFINPNDEIFIAGRQMGKSKVQFIYDDYFMFVKCIEDLKERICKNSKLDFNYIATILKKDSKKVLRDLGIINTIGIVGLYNNYDYVIFKDREDINFLKLSIDIIEYEEEVGSIIHNGTYGLFKKEI